MASQARPDRGATGIVIPVRSFTMGNTRLASALDAPARAALAESMADRVVDAAADAPCAVVSDAPEVRAWAVRRELEVLDDPGSLDGAAAAGRGWARDRGLTRYVVVHADLPNIRTLGAVVGDGDAPVAVLVTDHRGDGTPVLSLPTAADFIFAYGPGSAARHRAEAVRCGLQVRMVDDPDLAFDVDTPADLELLTRTESTP
jgi:2-phospho-L-lactate guanylyltransferase